MKNVGNTVCKVCQNEVPKQHISSFDKEDRWYNVCGKCVAETEYEELRAEMEENKRQRALRKERAKKAQSTVKTARTDEEARDKALNEVQKFEAEQKEIDLKRRAREELAARELARRHLLPYIMRFKRDYKPGWVHKVICHKLEQFFDDVKNERSPRLMLFMPPRHGKSEIVSNNFPSWVLGNAPWMEIMLSSYAVSLATDFSKANRDRIRNSDVYHSLFPDCRIDRNHEGAELWKTTVRGGFLAAGVGGPITGRGANVFIVDDPVKNYEEAESETVRESVKNWWRSTARTRLSPGGGVLIIQTRWHDDDLAGFLHNEYLEGMKEGIPEEELEKFEIISFPAEAESEEFLDDDMNLYKDIHEADVPVRKIRDVGDPLHPERYSLNYLRQTRRTMGERLYGALYQQNPVPDTGDFFRIEDFRYYTSEPHLGPRPVYFAWDFAVSLKQTSDFNVGVAAMYNEYGEVVVLDVLRGRWRVDELTDKMVELIGRFPHNAAKLGIERGVIWEAIKDTFFRKMNKRGLQVSIDYSLRPMTDKRIRARPLQAWMQAGKLKFPAGQPWMEQVKNELLRFDAGVHDDVVDAFAWLIRMLQDEARPDIASLRRSKDAFAVDKDRYVRDYVRDQRRLTRGKRWQAS